jgi:hypothetical protein
MHEPSFNHSLPRFGCFCGTFTRHAARSDRSVCGSPTSPPRAVERSPGDSRNGRTLLRLTRGAFALTTPRQHFHAPRDSSENDKAISDGGAAGGLLSGSKQPLDFARNQSKHPSRPAARSMLRVGPAAERRRG